MKIFLFISMFCALLFCINSISEGAQTEEDFKMTQSLWDQLFDKTNERISRLENILEAEKDQRQKFSSETNDYLSNLTKLLNQRVDKVEEMGSILKANNIARSFEDTINALNGKMSEMEKGFKDLEVRVTTIKKIYHVSQKPLETLMKVIDEQAAVINKINERLEKQEEMLLAMIKSSEDLVKGREFDKESATDSTGLEEQAASLHETEKGTEKPDIKMADTQEHSGQDIFIKNVLLEAEGLSTKISGEIINRSNIDYAVARYKIQFYDQQDHILESTDRVTANLNAGSTNKFIDIIFGINREDIARHVIIFNDRVLTTYQEEDEVQLPEKKMAKEVKNTVKEPGHLASRKKIVKLEKITPVEEKGFKAIGNDFYLRNVIISEFGNSTSIKGEIKNDSMKNFSSAKFGLKVLGEEGDVIVETEFSIHNIDINEIKPFDKIIRGVQTPQVSEYEIAFKYQ